jgi:AcrR family transcriptional regulator
MDTHGSPQEKTAEAPEKQGQTTSARRVGGRSARVRAAVFSAAIQLLEEHGYEAATMATIAKQAGVHETSLYRRWGTREALLAEALLTRAAAAMPVPDTGSIRSDLVQLLQTIVVFLHAPLGAAMVQLSLTTPPSPTFAQARSHYWQERFDLLTVIFERAIARGELPAELDPQLVLETVIGPIYLRLFFSGESLDQLVVEQVVDLVLDGVRAHRNSSNVI